MARIPEEELERIKREVSLELLVRSFGVELEQRGADLVGLCPFHDDRKSPSLVISPAKNLWNCLGACGEGGSVIDWVMKAEKVSFRHALELLRPRLGASPSKKQARPKLQRMTGRDLEDDQLLHQVVDFYHQTLKDSLEALKYLEQRGLRHPELLSTFKIGYANRTLGYRLPPKANKEGAAIRKRLQKLGLLRESGHEHFRGSLVIPILDEQGRVAEIYGRKIKAQLRKGTPLHLYLPGPHAGVFNLPALQASEELILCESLIDALTFWCAGYRNVTASFGTGGFTEDHLAAFKRHGIARVLIAYDRDEAGNKAADKLSQRLIRQGFECSRVEFPKGMDANEYALKLQPASESLGLVLRKAAWIGKGRSASEAAPIPAHAAPDQTPPPEETHRPPSSLAASQPAPAALAATPPERAPSPAADVPTERRGEDIHIELGDRSYRVRGLGRNMSFDQIKINLFVRRGAAFHVDTFDLYAARPRQAFIKHAAAELGLQESSIKFDLGKVPLKLEELQEAQIDQALEGEDKAPALTEEEREEALAFLRDPELLNRLLSDFESCGIIGEETNKLVGYLAATSRKLEEPLAVIIQSSSAAGKSSLMEAILSFIPEEEQIKYSAMTGQSLFYMGEKNLKHKILAIVEEEGAARASYALKLLQSEGELMIASTGKDPASGRLTTFEYRVEGPVMILLTTTAVEIDEELLNRCLVLGVNEGQEQTEAIHEHQRLRRTLDGYLARRDRKQVRRVHRNAQRLLRPLPVVNPFASRLTFFAHRTRARRDHEKYLSLIDAIALLHQYQRPLKTKEHGGERFEYLEVIPQDIALANGLAHEVLGRSLDELPPQTRRLLILLDAMVSKAAEELAIERGEVRFSRRDVREHTGWTDYQVKAHIKKLEELEYVHIHRGGRGQSFVYELAYEGGQDGRSLLVNLLDPKDLDDNYDGNLEGSKGDLEGRKADKEGRGRGPGGVAFSASIPELSGISRGNRRNAESTSGGASKNGASYRSFPANSPAEA